MQIRTRCLKKVSAESLSFKLIFRGEMQGSTAMHAWSHLRLILCSIEKTQSHCKLYIFNSNKQTFDHLAKFMCLPFELIFTMQYNV